MIVDRHWVGDIADLPSVGTSRRQRRRRPGCCWQQARKARRRRVQALNTLAQAVAFATRILRANRRKDLDAKAVDRMAEPMSQKRRRAAWACVHCRRRKIKCDGGRPCYQCQTSDNGGSQSLSFCLVPANCRQHAHTTRQTAV